MSNLVKRAKLFAKKAHSGQLRKYSGEPYFKHPEAVAALVAKTAGATPEQVAAAYLHDVVEDTEVTLEQLRKEFGETVARYVSDLTDVSTPKDGNRVQRKALDREHTARACREAKTVKLADLIHNTEDIVANDPEFAVTYLREKRLLLEVLREGDKELYQRAVELAREGQ